MSTARGDAGTLPRPGVAIEWDLGKLRLVQDAAAHYKRLVKRPTRSAPAESSSIAVRSAQRHFVSWIVQNLSAAARPTFDGDMASQREATNFAEALPMLLSIRSSLRKAGANVVANALDQHVDKQASRLLATADQQLSAHGGPYAIFGNTLEQWDGNGSLAAAAFDMSDIDSLKASLPARRGRVAQIAETFAAPIITYLVNTPGGTKARIDRWQRIIDVLAQQAAGDGDNSLARLEHFIITEIDRQDFSNCARFGQRTGAAEVDWFSQEQAQIDWRLGVICRVTNTHHAVDRYLQIRNDFNTTLAGRFPFSLDSNAPDAHPAEVQRFFVEYGARLPALEASIKAFRPSDKAAATALGQLISVSAALATMQRDPPQPLNYRVDVSFFTDPAIARGQNQVIAASVGTASSRAATPGTTTSFLWANGQPVGIDLRWAANAPTLPVPPGGGACVAGPAGATATFGFAGDWVLLRLLRDQAPPSTEARPDRTGAPIALVVPLCENPKREPGGDAVAESARIFMRMALVPTESVADKADHPVPVSLPVFPGVMPDLMRSKDP